MRRDSGTGRPASRALPPHSRAEPGERSTSFKCASTAGLSSDNFSQWQTRHSRTPASRRIVSGSRPGPPTAARGHTGASMAGRVRARLEAPKGEAWLCVFFRASLTTTVAMAPSVGSGTCPRWCGAPSSRACPRARAVQGVSRHVLFDRSTGSCFCKLLNSCLGTMSTSY